MRSAQVEIMKPDVEGQYVAKIIERERDIPRSLPQGNLLRLYFLSPNSRYSFFCGLLLIAMEFALLFFLLHPDPRYENSTWTKIFMVTTGILIVLTFGVPLLIARQTRNAIQVGVSAVGRVDSVKNARTTTYSTPEGMRNGSINAIVSYTVNGQDLHRQRPRPTPSTAKTYTVNGQEQRAEVFLDRPWVSAVETGTQLSLLVDPNKPSILYVVGIAEQRHR